MQERRCGCLSAARKFTIESPFAANCRRTNCVSAFYHFTFRHRAPPYATLQYLQIEELTSMAKKDYFVAMTEFHFMNPQTMSEITYYPDVQRWWGSVDGVMRAWS